MASNDDNTIDPKNRGDVQEESFLRKIAGFTEEMQPVYGDISSMASTASDIAALDDSVKNKVQNLSITADNLDGDSGDRYAWIWSGFEFKPLEPIQPVFDTIQLVLDTLLAILEALKEILEIILALLVGFDNLLKALVESILAKIEEIVGLFTGKTGVYILSIPPQLPPSPLAKQRIEVLRKSTLEVLAGTAAAYQAVINDLPDEKATIQDELEKSFAKVDTDSPDVFGFSVIPKEVSIAPSPGGMEGWVNTVQASLDDTKDMNRPQFGPNAYVAGMMLVYGFTDLTRIMDFLRGLKRIWGKAVKSTPVNMPPVPTGAKVEVLGMEMSIKKGVTPSIKVSWDAVPPRFIVADIFDKDDWMWEFAGARVYKMQDPSTLQPKEKSEMTVGGVSPPIGGDHLLENFESGKGSHLVNMREVDVNDKSAGVYIKALRFWIDETIKEADMGKTYLYRVSWCFKRFNKVSKSYEQAPDSEGGGDALLERFSPVMKIDIPRKGGGTTGISHNWQKWSIAELFPELAKLMEKLKAYIRAFLGLFPDMLAVIREFIKGLIREVNKWILFGTQLTQLIAKFRDLLNPGVGGHSLLFAGQGGNDFMMKILKDSVAKAKEIKAKEDAENTPKTPEERLEAAKQFWKHGRTGKSLEKIKAKDMFSSNPVPTFGENDAVGGLILYAGDEFYAGIEGLVKLFNLLFGDVREDEQSPEKAASEVIGTDQTTSALDSAEDSLNPERKVFSGDFSRVYKTNPDGAVPYSQTDIEADVPEESPSSDPAVAFTRELGPLTADDIINDSTQKEESC